MPWIHLAAIVVAGAIGGWLYLRARPRPAAREPRPAGGPGVIPAEMEAGGETAWVDPRELQPSLIQHPPFDEDVRGYVRQIHETFAEHRPISLEEWEEGFRRDGDPAREIAIWSHAADVYREMVAAPETTPEMRHDVYRVLVACMVMPREQVWSAARVTALPRPAAERVARRFYGDPA